MTTTEKHKTERNDWAEAISFISATLGEPFDHALADGLFWDAFSITGDDTVSLERLGEEIKITVYFFAIEGGHSVNIRFMAIMTWARWHNITAEID
jgi:hypothetical protein